MSKFSQVIINIVRDIPQGYVMSYGQVALYAGIPRAARQVGWVLNRSGTKEGIPWWRVVNNSGRISIKGSPYGAGEQRSLLEKEGIHIDNDLTFDIDKYRYDAKDMILAKYRLDPFYLTKISGKVGYNK